MPDQLTPDQLRRDSAFALAWSQRLADQSRAAIARAKVVVVTSMDLVSLYRKQFGLPRPARPDLRQSAS